jgi:hypothetical protein
MQPRGRQPNEGTRPATQPTDKMVTMTQPTTEDLQRVADEARKVMHTVHHGYREDIDFSDLDAALTTVFGPNYTDD